jgi:hypothetical protein
VKRGRKPKSKVYRVVVGHDDKRGSLVRQCTTVSVAASGFDDAIGEARRKFPGLHPIEMSVMLISDNNRPPSMFDGGSA